MSREILSKGPKKQIIPGKEELYGETSDKPISTKDTQMSLLNLGMRIRKAVSSGYKTKQDNSSASSASSFSNNNLTDSSILPIPYQPLGNPSIKRKRAP
ncbi:hypothetical protein T552_02388 [Pneumocystis carinii B80]|uniref:Uncharacterized protein n=1 Tax=Pneumocystis carinii (strain B80) TaxID=1408658 RepID=A0A0W4ZGB4_PNEC8|nr:hypothetical protein T552_02388 [Pneumocystis carinii B80]KTW27409.1 hypothetical protein T552_02388 [Pneumocystis carinii B80]